MARINWLRDELILAFNLYCKTPFGRIHIRNPEIIALAKLLGRTPSAVSWKLANFARLDPSLRARQIKGASHGASADIEVWEEFNSDWSRLAFESEKLLAKLTGRRIEETIEETFDEAPRAGKERESIVKVRVNQSFFRQSVLAAYDVKCCITGLAIPQLLCASHIVPWAVDIANRVNPRNGLCLNPIHDRAFDRGLITINSEYKVVVSRSIKLTPGDSAAKAFILDFAGRSIRLPKRFRPDPVLLKYHNERIFRDTSGKEAEPR